MVALFFIANFSTGRNISSSDNGFATKINPVLKTAFALLGTILTL
jgi:hypothetical protein